MYLSSESELGWQPSQCTHHLAVKMTRLTSLVKHAFAMRKWHTIMISIASGHVIHDNRLLDSSGLDKACAFRFIVAAF